MTGSGLYSLGCVANVPEDDHQNGVAAVDALVSGDPGVSGPVRLAPGSMD